LNLKERGTKRPAKICPLVFAKRFCNPFRRGLSIRRHAVSGELPAPLVILWGVLKGMIPRPTRGIMSFCETKTTGDAGGYDLRKN
jgi:hypothetical protein